MKGFKTILFNIGMLALGSPDILALLPPRAAIYTTIFGNLVLRAITNTPIGRQQ